MSKQGLINMPVLHPREKSVLLDIKREKIALIWETYLPYHLDRLQSLHESACGIFIAQNNLAYRGFHKPELPLNAECLFENDYETISKIAIFIALVRAIKRWRVGTIFLCGYQNPEIAAFAILMRLSGRRVFVMQDSRFADKPRRLSQEWLKSLLYAPYNGALVAGHACANYLRFLSFRSRVVVPFGYDTISLSRIRQLAGDHSPKPNAPFLFVGRIIKKKGVPFLIEAYSHYRALVKTPRKLHIVGDGADRIECERIVREQQIAGVSFIGSLNANDVAREMATARALLIPSKYEEWGLVVNEALAFNLPVVVSHTVGAVDTLVRDMVSGFVLEPENHEGWIQALVALDTDQQLYERFVRGASGLCDQADVSKFREAVNILIDNQNNAKVDVTEGTDYAN